MSTEIVEKSLPAITPAQMVVMAIEQNADLDKLEKLMGLMERDEAKHAKKAYIIAMSEFRARCPSIEKTRTGHKIKYAGLAETIDQIKDLLSECSLSHSWKTDQCDGNISVTCTVTHINGHSESTSLAAPPDTSGSKNSIQAVGSTITYLQRYTMYAILGLASQEMDTDETPPAALDAINAATTLDELQGAFRDAWNTYPKARKELTGAKDSKSNFLGMQLCIGRERKTGCRQEMAK